MAVFPENMDKLSADDVPGSLSIIENYIRYMGERMEFAMRNMTKTVSAAGVSSAEMYVLLMALQNTVSALTSTVQGIAGDMTSVKSDVGSIKTDISSLQATVSGIQEQITSLDARVTALESKNATT